MKRTQKWLYVLLIVVIMALMLACTDGGGGNGDNNVETVVTQESSEACRERVYNETVENGFPADKAAEHAEKTCQ